MFFSFQKSFGPCHSIHFKYSQPVPCACVDSHTFIMMKYLRAFILSIIYTWPLKNFYNSFFFLYLVMELTIFNTLPWIWIKIQCYFLRFSKRLFRCITIIAKTNLFFINLICFSSTRYIFLGRSSCCHHRNIIIACKFIANMYKQNNWHLSSQTFTV